MTRAGKIKDGHIDVFVYFDNTDKLRAPLDAQALMKKLESSRRDDRANWIARAGFEAAP